MTGRRLATAVLVAASLVAACDDGIGDLRREPRPRLAAAEVAERLAEHGFYDAHRNPGGSGISHRYRLEASGEVVVDGATGLEWQRGGSAERLTYPEAEAYVAALDAGAFAGREGWRLPTLEEAASLLEPEKNAAGLHLDPVFDVEVWWIWTADRQGPVGGWVVTFADGTCFVHVPMGGSAHVRAVRTEEP